MNKLICIAAIVSFISPALIAQKPSSPTDGVAVATATPAPAPAVAPAAMKLPPQTQAAFVAGQIIQQVTTILSQVIQVIDNGVPAQPGTAEISAKDLQAALGAENVMRLRSAVAILSDAPPPAPVTPKPIEGGSPAPEKP